LPKRAFVDGVRPESLEKDGKLSFGEIKKNIRQRREKRGMWFFKRTAKKGSFKLSIEKGVGSGGAEKGQDCVVKSLKSEKMQSAGDKKRRKPFKAPNANRALSKTGSCRQLRKE